MTAAHLAELATAHAPELIALAVGALALVVGDLLDGRQSAARDLRAEAQRRARADEARERAEALAAIAKLHRPDDLIPPPTGGWGRTATRQGQP